MKKTLAVFVAALILNAGIQLGYAAYPIPVEPEYLNSSVFNFEGYYDEGYMFNSYYAQKNYFDVNGYNLSYTSYTNGGCLKTVRL